MPADRPSRTALVTGASSGFGALYARRFAEDGIDVVLVARRRDRLEALAGELEGVTSHVIAADLSRLDEVDGLIARLAERGTTIDYLVNNAGFGTSGPFVELDADRERDQIQVNVAALSRLTRALLPGMVERGFGRVLNVSSTAGFQPGPNMATYYATKGFVLNFSEAIAYELRGTGVTVTAHCPGAAATEFPEVSGNGKSNLFVAGVARADDVVRHGYAAMHAGKVIAVPGVLNWLGTVVVGYGPRWLVRRILAFINAPAR